MTRRDWLVCLIALVVFVVVEVGVLLALSYATPSSCTPHAIFVGNTVIEYCR
jgi:hypothetical protein